MKAITFYQHKETPGLGGEVDSEKFQNEFVGKKIYDNDWNLESIGIVKAPNNNQVQAISGATIKIGILNVNNIAFVLPASPTSPSSTAILD